jgi:hypothetical protein
MTVADEGDRRLPSGSRPGESTVVPPPSRRSLRWRLGGWTIAVVSVTLMAATAVRVVDENRRMIARETTGANALLDRLVGTPEMQRGVSDARAMLQIVQPALVAEYASVALDPSRAPIPADGRLLAKRSLPFREGDYELRYLLSRERFASATREAIAFHAVHGVLTLLLLLAGMEWILRRRLLDPLHQLSHQVNHMGAGGGWQPVLPETDAEILEIRSAVRDLGPALAGQVDEWIEGEKRAAVALAMARLRAQLREPQRRALVLLGDLQAAGGVTPAGKVRARALTLEVEALSRVIDEAEVLQMPMTGAPSLQVRSDHGRLAPERRSAP